MTQIATTQQELIEDAVEEICLAKADLFSQALAKPELRNWFVGKVMLRLNGAADIELVRKVVAEKFARVASRQELTDAAARFAEFRQKQVEMDRDTWASLYLQQWPDQESFLVAARSLSEARGFVRQYEGANVSWTAVAFGQALTGLRFDRIIVLTPVGSFTTHEAQYVQEVLPLRLAAVDAGLLIVPR